MIPLDLIVLAIYGLHGALGSSKTWGAVMLAWLYQMAGYQVWSDIPLNPNYFPNYVNLDEPFPRELAVKGNGEQYENGWEYLEFCAVTGLAFPYKNIYMLFDEWQYHSDARLHASMQNIVYSYLFIQSRKRGLVVCMTSKEKGYLDTRDRGDEDISVKCYKKHWQPNSPQKSDKKCFDHECQLRHYFHWIIIDVQNKVGKEQYFMEPNYIFPMYDTDDLSAPVREINTSELKAAVSSFDKGGKV